MLNVLQNTLPLWDTFKAQAADLVNAKLDELDIERVMLPKNMTHLLQHLDLAPNGTMKKM